MGQSQQSAAAARRGSHIPVGRINAPRWPQRHLMCRATVVSRIDTERAKHSSRSFTDERITTRRQCLHSIFAFKPLRTRSATVSSLFEPIRCVEHCQNATSRDDNLAQPISQNMPHPVSASRPGPRSIPPSSSALAEPAPSSPGSTEPCKQVSAHLGHDRSLRLAVTCSLGPLSPSTAARPRCQKHLPVTRCQPFPICRTHDRHPLAQG